MFLSKWSSFLDIIWHVLGFCFILNGHFLESLIFLLSSNGIFVKDWKSCSESRIPCSWFDVYICLDPNLHSNNCLCFDEVDID